MEDSTLQSLEDLLGGSKETQQVQQRQVVSPVAEPVQDAVASVVEEPVALHLYPKHLNRNHPCRQSILHS